MTTLDRLREIFQREFKVPLPGFSLETTPDNLREWNSVAHVSLILEIEREFGIQFSTEELGSLEDVRAIYGTVEAKIFSNRSVPKPK